MTRKTTLVHDGDHGGDDFITTLLFAAWPEKFDLLAVTCNFGNGPIGRVVHNALCALDYGGRADIPVYRGSGAPFRGAARESDDVFGEGGICGVIFPQPQRAPEEQDAVGWLEDLLEQAAAPLTLCVTGPLTNMAHLLERRPDLKHKIEKLIIMGGCLGPLPPHDRCGNITPYAEFNFYMDPPAADFVLTSGVKIILFPLDVTQQFIFTPSRCQRLTDTLPRALGERIVPMLRAAEKWDKENFDLEGSAIHDENVCLYLLDPSLYQTRDIALRVSTAPESAGRMIRNDAPGAPSVTMACSLDSDRAFDLMLQSLQRLRTAS